MILFQQENRGVAPYPLPAEENRKRMEQGESPAHETTLPGAGAMRKVMFYVLVSAAGFGITAGVVFSVAFVAAVIPHAGVF